MFIHPDGGTFFGRAAGEADDGLGAAVGGAVGAAGIGTLICCAAPLTPASQSLCSTKRDVTPPKRKIPAMRRHIPRGLVWTRTRMVLTVLSGGSFAAPCESSIRPPAFVGPGGLGGVARPAR